MEALPEASVELFFTSAPATGNGKNEEAATPPASVAAPQSTLRRLIGRCGVSIIFSRGVRFLFSCTKDSPFARRAEVTYFLARGLGNCGSQRKRSRISSCLPKRAPAFCFWTAGSAGGLGLEAGEFVDAGGEIGGIEDGWGACAVGADEGGGASEFGILDVGIGEFAFGGVPPFQALVAGGIAEGGLEEGLRGGIVFVADDGEMERGAADFEVGEQGAGGGETIDDGN